MKFFTDFRIVKIPMEKPEIPDSAGINQEGEFFEGRREGGRGEEEKRRKEKKKKRKRKVLQIRKSNSEILDGSFFWFSNHFFSPLSS